MQDLWADFADEALSTAGAGGGKGLRQHRLTESAVLMALRAWLLQEYMLPYGTSLGATRIFRRCYWIDGLGNTRSPTRSASLSAQDAAPRSEGGRQKAVPPTLQLVDTTARQLAQLERPIALHGLLLAERGSKRKAEQVRKGAAANTVLTLPKEGGLLSANWVELARSGALLTALEQSAAVFLLNPLQDDLARYTDLAPLYGRTAPTELFLWLPHKQVETHLLAGLHTTEGAAALTNLLRSDRWKALAGQKDEKPERVISGFVALFAESMRPHFLTVQTLAFPINRGPALVEAVPYSLLFATRRQDSLGSLNDAVCLRERRLRAASQQGVLNEAWFTSQREEQAAARREVLVRETLALGRAQRIRRWPDLRHQLVLAFFGQHTLHDYDQIITSLLALGEVRCEWGKRAQERGETPIPTNDDLLLWR